MFKIREWERYCFMIAYEHDQARSSGWFQAPGPLNLNLVCWTSFNRHCMLVPPSEQARTPMTLQHKKILERKLPESLKLAIAKKIENNLFSKVR